MKLSAIVALIGFLPAARTPAQTMLINEIDADQSGTDSSEFIELYDGGTGNVSLDGYVIVFYNGSNDLSYRAIDLDGNATNAQGYFVIGNVPQADLVPGVPADWIQNGADAIALYRGDAQDFPNGTAITGQNLVDAIVYDTDDADDAGLLPLLDPGEPQVNENMGGNKDTESLQRSPDGTGGPRHTSSYRASLPTPGNANPLPITISTFTAVLTGSAQVQLSWTTETEFNTFGFMVERKGDLDFAEIPGSFIPGAGTTTTPQSYQYVDAAPPAGLLHYRIRQTDLDGAIHYSGVADVEVVTHVGPAQPGTFYLSQNYPNPFNPATHFEFGVTRSLPVRVTLLNIIGQEVGVLFDGPADAGRTYRVDLHAQLLSDGVYLYRLESAEGSITRKLIVLR
jgi:hypothetical protein